MSIANDVGLFAKNVDMEEALTIFISNSFYTVFNTSGTGGILFSLELPLEEESPLFQKVFGENHIQFEEKPISNILMKFMFFEPEENEELMVDEDEIKLPFIDEQTDMEEIDQNGHLMLYKAMEQQ